MENHFYHVTADFEIQYKKRDYEYQMPILHYHNSYELYFLEEGNRNILVNEKIFNISRYDIVLHKPNTFHRSSGGTNHSRTVLYFTKEYLSKYFTSQTVEVMLSCFEDNVIFLNKELFKSLKELLLKLEKEDRDHPNNHTFAYLFDLLMLISENRKKFIPNIVFESPSSKNILPILTYVGQNYKNISNITQIADQFYITKYHLCRIFKHHTGLTITQYINGVKVHQACELLRQTDTSVTDIGFVCGFNSTMYFCKTFKHITNMTPNSFRQHMSDKA